MQHILFTKHFHREEVKVESRLSKRLLTVKELSAILKISPRTIYNGIHRRATNRFPIKAKRVGKLIRFDRKDVDEYIQSL